MGKGPSERVLADTFTEAMRLRQLMRADGASEAELQQTLEKAIRGAWPFVREWKYLCDDCDDTGLVMQDCSGQWHCGVLTNDRPHPPHRYGMPCRCAAGNRFKSRPKTDGDFTQATQQKPKGFTRVGR